MLFAQVEQAGNNLSTWTQNNGLAVVLLFMFLISFGIAVYKTFNWLAANVVLPFRDSIISHLTQTDKTMEAMQGTMKGIHEEIKKTREIVDSKHDLLHARIDEISQRKCQIP